MGASLLRRGLGLMLLTSLGAVGLFGCSTPAEPQSNQPATESTETVVRAGWADQLQYLRPIAEPSGDATAGVYLGLIVPGEEGTTSFRVDWVSSDGLWATSEHGSKVTNTSGHLQSLSLHPLGTVFVDEPLGASRPGGSGPTPVNYREFFSELNGGGEVSHEHMKSLWFVTVEGDRVSSLVEAPGTD